MAGDPRLVESVVAKAARSAGSALSIDRAVAEIEDLPALCVHLAYPQCLRSTNLLKLVQHLRHLLMGSGPGRSGAPVRSRPASRCGARRGDPKGLAPRQGDRRLADQ
jgi:hypothetical protein